MLKKIGAKILQEILIGTVAILALNAIDNVVNGKDILGRNPDPSKTYVNYKGDIVLGTDNYTIV